MEIDINKLDGFEFIHGVGDVDEKQLCLLSATAYLAGEPHGDHPVCACPVLTELGIKINDGPWWADNAERGVWVLATAPRLIGTRSSKAVERQRADILVRAALTEFVPDALDHAARALELAGLQEHANTLRDHATKLRTAADAAYAAAAYAAAAAAYAAARAADAADAKTSIRDRLIALMDECLAITEPQPVVAEGHVS